MGSLAVIRLCRYIVYFNHFNYITRRAGGPQPPVKDQDTLTEQALTRINEAHRIIVKKVVYDKFMKQIRHSFNTTGMANYRVQLAVPPSIKNNHNNTVLKNMYSIRNFQLD